MEKNSLKFTIESSLSDLIENNLEVHSGQYYEPFILTTAQKSVLNAIESETNVVVKKHRQVGMTSFISAIAASRLLSNERWNILYIPGNCNLGKYTLDKTKDYLHTINGRLNLNIDIEYSNKTSFILSNGNSFYTVSPRAYSFGVSGYPSHSEQFKKTWIIFEEASFNKNAEDIYYRLINQYCYGQVTIISNQNGIDDLFFPIYVLGEKAGFKKIDARYQETEYLVNIKDQMSKCMSDKNFDKEFGDCFYDDNFKMKRPEEMIELLKPFVLKNEKLTFFDFVEIAKQIKFSK
jgi:hypothetical protein